MKVSATIALLLVFIVGLAGIVSSKPDPRIHRLFGPPREVERPQAIQKQEGAEGEKENGSAPGEIDPMRSVHGHWVPWKGKYIKIH